MPALVPDPGTNEQAVYSSDFGSDDSEGSTLCRLWSQIQVQMNSCFKSVILDQLILRGAHCVSSGPDSGTNKQLF